MKLTNKRWIAAALLVPALGVAGCSSEGSGTSHDQSVSTTQSGSGIQAGSGTTCNGSAVNVSLALGNTPYLPIFVASGAGYFKKVGVKLNQVNVAKTSSKVAAVLSGDVDISVSTAAGIYDARQKGAAVKVVGALSLINSNFVVKKSILDKAGLTADSPIIAKLRALKGKTISVDAAGNGTDLIARYMLTSAGLNPDRDVHITYSGNTNLSEAAFVANRSDAFLASSPSSDQGIEQGNGVYLDDLAKQDYPPLANTLYVILFSSDSVIKQKAKTLTCFLRAVGMAEQLIHRDPAAAAKDARSSFSSLSDSLYKTAFYNTAPSFFQTPVIDMASAQNALKLQNTGKSKLDPSLVTKSIDNSLAIAAMKGL